MSFYNEMNKQPEALRMADRLEGRYALHPEVMQAAAELRRLYAANQELLGALKETTTEFVIAANDGGVNLYHYAQKYGAIINQFEI
jgi:hypothetical protein